MVTTAHHRSEKRCPIVIEDRRDPLDKILSERGMNSPFRKTTPTKKGVGASPQVSERR